MASNTVDKAANAKAAALKLAKTPGELKNKALKDVAKALKESQKTILEANRLDCEKAKDKITPTLYKRLELTKEKIDTIIEGVLSVASLDEPIGKTLTTTELDKDLTLYKVTTPIGVIGCVFESRPDALVQIASLCLKSGNATILKGGSESNNTNRRLYEIIKDTSEKAGIPGGWIQLAEGREEVTELLKLDNLIDLMIPRGSNEFVKYIKDNTKIPVLGHSAGICHVYVDAAADLKKAENIAYDAKCQYPAVCNAMETLLVDEKIADKFLPKIWAKYESAGVKGKGCDKAKKIIKNLDTATEQDYHTEYNDLKLNIKVVGGVDEAINWINTHGSHHTDAIVTEDDETARKFMDSVDSSSVMWNASTRFADGFRYGLGAEVGISTNKVHARGPVGLDGLTTYKWLLKGAGHTVADYKNRKYTHKKLEKRWKTSF